MSAMRVQPSVSSSPNAAETLDVPRSGREVREPRLQVGVGVADEPGFGGEPQQCLQHGEGEEFGVGEFGGDPDSGPFGSPLWVVDEEIVDGDVESGREGVQVRVHALCPPGSGFVQAP